MILSANEIRQRISVGEIKTHADALREIDTDALAALLGGGPCPPDVPEDECLDDREGDCCKCWRRWLDLPAGEQ